MAKGNGKKTKELSKGVYRETVAYVLRNVQDGGVLTKVLLNSKGSPLARKGKHVLVGTFLSRGVADGLWTLDERNRNHLVSDAKDLWVGLKKVSASGEKKTQPVGNPAPKQGDQDTMEKGKLTGPWADKSENQESILLAWGECREELLSRANSDEGILWRLVKGLLVSKLGFTPEQLKANPKVPMTWMVRLEGWFVRAGTGRAGNPVRFDLTEEGALKLAKLQGGTKNDSLPEDRVFDDFFGSDVLETEHKLAKLQAELEGTTAQRVRFENAAVLVKGALIGLKKEERLEFLAKYMEAITPSS